MSGKFPKLEDFNPDQLVNLLSEIMEEERRVKIPNLDSLLGLKPYKIPEPKNKHDLTDEQIEQMASMTPKEKKKFLKSLTLTRTETE